MGTDGRREAALLLSECLQELAHDIRRGLDPALRACNLVSVLQVAMLGVLRRHGPMRLVDLSRHVNVPTSTLSELVDRLVDNGFVTREPNPEDRRSVVLAATARGAETLDSVRCEGAAQVGRLLQQLDDQTVDNLLVGLRRLHAALAAAREAGREPGPRPDEEGRER